MISKPIKNKLIILHNSINFLLMYLHPFKKDYNLFKLPFLNIAFLSEMHILYLLTISSVINHKKSKNLSEYLGYINTSPLHIYFSK